MSIVEDVRAFRIAGELPYSDGPPKMVEEHRVQLHLKLIAEEFLEVLEASGIEVNYIKREVDYALRQTLYSYDGDIVGIADGLADLDYVVQGFRDELGIDEAGVRAEVQRSNMAKFADGIKRRPDGKITKPEGWTPPDIAGELRRQGWNP